MTEQEQFEELRLFIFNTEECYQLASYSVEEPYDVAARCILEYEELILEPRDLCICTRALATRVTAYCDKLYAEAHHE